MQAARSQDQWSAINWARFYAADLGWSVLPVRPRSKAPLYDPSLGLCHGRNDATADPDHVEAIWSRYPDAGVAVTTGAESSIVVLDVDPRNGGDESWVEFEAEMGTIDLGPVSLTGGGGSHSFFAHPGAPIPCRNNLGRYRGIDLKGDGGYIIAPPSIHPSGGTYRWNPLLHVLANALPPCPEVVLEFVSSPTPGPTRHYSPAPWDGRCPPDAARLIARCPKIHARFHRSTEEITDRTPSGVDFSLACQLAVAGLAPPLIEAAVRASRSEAELPPRRESYFVATVGKAIAFAESVDRGRNV